MSRRGTPQVLALVAVAVVFLYGFYEYHELKAALRRSEDIGKRSKVEKENLSTQLQAANEQKLRLEASLQKERENFKKSKDELLTSKSELELKCKSDKKELTDKFLKLSEEAKQVKAEYEAVQSELETHKDRDAQHEEERTKLSAENKRLKQESANELAVLQDEVANLKRQNAQLQSKLAASQQKLAAKPAETADHQNVDNRIPQMGPGQQAALQGGGKDDSVKPVVEVEIPMQINKPGDNKPYFEPKEAKPDHPILKRDVPRAGADKSVNQVAAPEVEDEHNEVVNRQNLPRRAARERPDENVANRHLNPVFPGNDQAREPHIGGDTAEFGKVAKMPNLVPHGLHAAAIGDPQQRNLVVGDAHNQVEKPLQIAEPHLDRNEDQLQEPQNKHNPQDKDDDGNNDDDGDYQYDDKKDKAAAAAVDADRNANDGPHAAPVDEDDLGKEGGGL